MQAVLVMIRSDGERRSFSIAREMTVVGRREDCDLRIPLGEISRKHCRLVRDGDELRLEDLGSSNGTFHNGDRIQDTVLAAGDTIQIGPVVFVLQIDGVPSDEDIHPVATQDITGASEGVGSGVGQAEEAGAEDYVQEGNFSVEPEAEIGVGAEAEPEMQAEHLAEEEPLKEPVAEEYETPVAGEYAAPAEEEYAEPVAEAYAAPVAEELGTAAEESPEVASEDELFLTEESVPAEAHLAAGEEDFNPLADMHVGEGEESEPLGADFGILESSGPADGEFQAEHAEAGEEDFTSLETPEPPHGELHLEDANANLDAHHHPNL